MGDSPERGQAEKEAWDEIHAIQDNYFLSRTGPRPAKIRPDRVHRNVVILVCIAMVGLLAFVLDRPATKPDSTAVTTTSLPWYCNPGILPRGQAAGNALRDCPQFANYRASVAQVDAQWRAEGRTPPPPVWEQPTLTVPKAP